MTESDAELVTVHGRRAILDDAGQVVKHEAWTEERANPLGATRAEVITEQGYTFLLVTGVDEADVQETFVAHGRALREQLGAGK